MTNSAGSRNTLITKLRLARSTGRSTTSTRRGHYDQVIRDFGPERPFINLGESDARHIDALAHAFRAPWSRRAPMRGWLVSRTSRAVRYRNYGYDHIVHLRSRCKLDAFCEVSRDVTPKPVEVVVAPRGRRDVLLFRSPTQQFTARVECRFLPA